MYEFDCHTQFEVAISSISISFTVIIATPPSDVLAVSYGWSFCATNYTGFIAAITSRPTYKHVSVNLVLL